MVRARRANRPLVGPAVLAAALLLAGCGGVSLHRSESGTAAEAAPSSTSATPPSPSASVTTTAEPAPQPPTTTAKPSTTTKAPPKPSSTTAPSTPKPTRSTVKAAPTPTAKPTPKPKPTPTPTRAPSARDTLKPGMSGAYVKVVQQRLSSLGYWLGTPDGTYGGLTTQAVMALQKAAGLGRDGVYGPQTRTALQAGVRPSSRIGGTGVEVDKAKQLLLVVRGGTVATILNTSTGSGQAYISSDGAKAIATTPSGAYTVYYTVDKLDHGKLGDLWRPRYFDGGIAVHGAGYVPGYPASHGCARVSNPAIDMIWADNLMPMGSRVVVY